MSRAAGTSFAAALRCSTRLPQLLCTRAGTCNTSHVCWLRRLLPTCTWASALRLCLHCIQGGWPAEPPSWLLYKGQASNTCCMLSTPCCHSTASHTGRLEVLQVHQQAHRAAAAASCAAQGRRPACGSAGALVAIWG